MPEWLHQLTWIVVGRIVGMLLASPRLKQNPLVVTFRGRIGEFIAKRHFESMKLCPGLLSLLSTHSCNQLLGLSLADSSMSLLDALNLVEQMLLYVILLYLRRESGMPSPIDLRFFARTALVSVPCYPQHPKYLQNESVAFQNLVVDGVFQTPNHKPWNMRSLD